MTAKTVAEMISICKKVRDIRIGPFVNIFVILFQTYR